MNKYQWLNGSTSKYVSGGSRSFSERGEYMFAFLFNSDFGVLIL